MSDTSIGHMPSTPRWEFDAAVTACFEDMLQRSIPQYEVMRDAVTSLAAQHVTGGSLVIDLGCSWGTALSLIREEYRRTRPWLDDIVGHPDEVRFEGYEVSKPMFEKASSLFAHAPDVHIYDADIRQWSTGPNTDASVVLSVLTLQFVPINYRQQIIREAFNALEPGGVFIVVEKVLGEGADVDDMLVKRYHEHKAQGGYSLESVRAKQEALEGVLVPVTASMNEQMLRAAGFREVDCFWRWMNFAGWVAVR